jgi:hypothetical protein
MEVVEDGSEKRELELVLGGVCWTVFGVFTV